MITRGSKFFYGAGTFGLLMALLYGFVTASSATGGVGTTVTSGGVINAIVGPLSLGWKGGVGDHVGYSVLLAFAGVMFVIGAFSSALRDADAEAIAEVQGVAVEDLPAATQPYGLSFWPVVAAFSAGLVVVGLAFSLVLFYAGIIGLVIAGFEWTVRAWSERATGDPAMNAAYRNQLLRPLEVPIGAVLVIAVVAVAVSRVLLAVSKLGATFVIIGLAAVVFGLANLLARRPELKRSVLVGVLLIGGLVIIGSGIAAGVAGQREIEHHGEEGAGLPVVSVPAVSAADSVATGTDGY